MTRDDMMAVVKQNLREVVAPDKLETLTDKDSLADFGADSLEIVEVVSRSMKQLKLRVRRTDLTDAKNVGDLLDLFEKAAQS